MKNFSAIVFALSLSASAFAADVPKACYGKAEKAVEKEYGSDRDRYDVGGFEAMDCEMAPNKAAVICEVAASKGEGAAYDTFRVVLNKTCTRSFRVDLIGEE